MDAMNSSEGWGNEADEAVEHFSLSSTFTSTGAGRVGVETAITVAIGKVGGLDTLIAAVLTCRAEATLRDTDEVSEGTGEVVITEMRRAGAGAGDVTLAVDVLFTTVTGPVRREITTGDDERLPLVEAVIVPGLRAPGGSSTD
eukprot:CAMPEP_0197660566 /NCGR_PEP_ID=MMETSP1338-20131121/50924_1 /TAXON_ID=43686 ORGANISM="Pelagodinium beii, Strain RCC1491" /NCGR_SAMPLE_ID=MMETSP1338 /ASSEMBLY_ACC=CAM_ASM_000754 /LENGTH=142 /DNA_ID=CAMNT_0043237939 /DNA_START=240 /DNA_END=669 /DNA_ORIENTATION=+